MTANRYVQYSPAPGTIAKMGVPSGCRFMMNQITGNILAIARDNRRWLYDPNTEELRQVDLSNSFAPSSPKPKGVNDRPPLIDDVEDEDDRDLVQTLTNMMFKGRVSPHDILKVVRDRGWVPVDDLIRANARISDLEDALNKERMKDTDRDRAAQAGGRIVRGSVPAPNVVEYSVIETDMDSSTIKVLKKKHRSFMKPF